MDKFIVTKDLATANILKKTHILLSDNNDEYVFVNDSQKVVFEGINTNQYYTTNRLNF